jgi:hypothetical protein
MAGALKQGDDVLRAPAGVVLLADDDVGGFDEGPLEVLVGGLAHVSEAGLAAAGVDGGHEAGVTGELTWRVEAVDAADLPIDDDGQDVSDTGKALEQLDGGGQSNPLPDPLFELIDLELESVKGFNVLGDAAACLRGKSGKGRLQPDPAGADEHVDVFRAGDAVLGQGGVDTVLEGGPELGERHPGVMELTLVADLPGGSQTVGRLSRCRSLAKPLASSLSVLPKVPGTGVDVAHHDLGLGGVRQERQATRSFDLIGNPVPVAHALQGDRGAFGQALQEYLDGAGLVIEAGLVTELAISIGNRELRIATMGVATHSVMSHSCTAFTCLVTRHECSGRCSAFI